jgi:hypothetical protein
MMMLRQAIRMPTTMANAVRSACEKLHAEDKVRDAIKAGMKATAVFCNYGAL